MYFTLPKIAERRLAFSATANFLKFFRLSFRVGRLRRQSSGIVNFIERSIKKDDVVINIGSGEDDYLYIILKRLGRSGKIIVFESQPELYQHLAHLKKYLNGITSNWSPCFFQMSVLKKLFTNLHIKHRLMELS